MDSLRSIGVIGGITLLITGLTIVMPSVAATHLLDLLGR